MTSFSYRAKAAALVLFSSGAFVPSVPVEAASVIARCAIPQPCAIYLNSAGWGFQAITEATTGFHAGLQGADISTNFGFNDGVLGTVINGRYGVEGKATGTMGIGGVGGTATTGDGVDGVSTFGKGVYGESYYDTGVVAQSVGSGLGAYVSSNTGNGIVVNTGPGEPAQPGANTAIFAQDTNIYGTGGDFRGTSIGLRASAPANGFLLRLTDPDGNALFYVDGAGNVVQKGNATALARTAAGGTVKSYSVKSTLPTVEDTGTAQLVRGTATIRFDSAFEASIDPSVAYRVFVTPSGDTHGLFVPTKTAAGFVVREAQGGRATVSFDYRVVATALGQTHLRMALVPAMEADAKVAAPKVPELKPVRPQGRSERQNPFVNDLNFSI